MKLWILTSDSGTFSSSALEKAFSSLKVPTEVLDPNTLGFQLSCNSIEFFKNGNRIEKPKFALLRLGWKSLKPGLLIGKALQSAGVSLFNDPESFQLAAHKLNSLLTLHRSGVPVPQSFWQAASLSSQFYQLNEKMVFKQFYGSQGFGVSWSDTYEQGIAMIDAYRNAGVEFYGQEMVTESFGRDIRILVANKKIVGTIERAHKSDLRSNLHQGGESKLFVLDKDLENLAVQCCQALNLTYAGVDLLIARSGPVVIEVNPAPGLEGMSKTLNKNIALELAKELTTHF